MIVTIFGPGGVGKGALASLLVAHDPRLWLSRSWTTRARRPHEAEDAYVFVTTEAFEAAMARAEFLETNRFAANDRWYGTPWPRPPDEERDVVLEIDVNGARQVKARYPESIAILVVPPSRAELERRLRGRGDDEEHVQRRLDFAEVEVAEGRELADHVVINDDLDRAVAEVARILAAHRTTRPTRPTTEGSNGD